MKSSQRRLLKVTRDRSYLLDRLLQYEKADCSSTESDDTESSDDDVVKTESKKRKLDLSGGPMNVKITAKKKRQGAPKKQQMLQPPSNNLHHLSGHVYEHDLTVEEVERHLESRPRPSILELMPERPPPIVPTEMFSNEPSSESNEMIENLGEDCLDLMYGKAE